MNWASLNVFVFASDTAEVILAPGKYRAQHLEELHMKIQKAHNSSRLFLNLFKCSITIATGTYHTFHGPLTALSTEMPRRTC